MSLKMGAYSYAVSGYYFGVEIRRYCSIGEGVQIGRHSHPLDFGSTSPLFYTNKQNVLGTSVNHFGSDSDYLFKPKRAPTTFKPTVIGNDVYIGHDAFILPGVKIGNGAVIGARAVVTKDVPSYAIVAGCPAMIKRYRFTDDIIDELERTQWWKFSLRQLRNVDPTEPLSFIEIARELTENKTNEYTPILINLEQFCSN
jgi:acetyltransferase-like isoleucine patch superfamily enzyme